MKPDDIFDKKKQKKIHEETIEKFVGRVENMIYSVCGCGYDYAEEVLKECLDRNGRAKRENEKKKM
ncbi:MAG: hypothetical protein Q8N63_03120 [Nanoarchaeota archaeon]|nr:hypothetical protein [Nanoarchaeota archaeon]